MKFLKFSYTIFSWSVPIHKKKNEQYSGEKDRMGNHRRICFLTVSPTYIKHLDSTYCSLQGSPLGVPFIRCGTNAQCSLHAEQDETKGRKTHAQTNYSMDTAADGTRADCDVHCTVAYDG